VARVGVTESRSVKRGAEILATTRVVREHQFQGVDLRCE
jgi:hypothetical protein